MKYIITKHNGVAIFSEGETHAKVAKGMDGEIVSAGFLHFNAECNKEDSCEPVLSVHCFGDSFSLNLESRGKTDEEIIMRHLTRY